MLQDHGWSHPEARTLLPPRSYGKFAAYDRPPRVARDLREEGVPLETFRIKSNRTGRKIAAYRFNGPTKIKRGRVGGRKVFSKAFKDALIERYGEFAVQR